MAELERNPTINWQALNLHEEWKRFEQHSKLMFMGPLKHSTREEWSAYLLLWVGEAGRNIFNSWAIPEDDANRTDVDFLIDKFRFHTAPKGSVILSRCLFLERRQRWRESAKNYITDLQNLVRGCAYQNPEEMVRDKVASGILSQHIRKKLLAEGDSLTLEKAVEIATACDEPQHSDCALTEMKTEQDVAIHSVKKEVDKDTGMLDPVSHTETSPAFQLPKYITGDSEEGSRSPLPVFFGSHSFSSLSSSPGSFNSDDATHSTTESIDKQGGVLNKEEHQNSSCSSETLANSSRRDGRSSESVQKRLKNQSNCSRETLQNSSQSDGRSNNKSVRKISYSEAKLTFKSEMKTVIGGGGDRSTGKKHVCSVCSKAFGKSRDLMRHTLIHTGEKNYVCEVCRKAFKQPAHLSQHKLTHGGHKNHVCDVCKKAFTVLSNLKRHKLIHAGQRGCVCVLCQKAFIDSNSLKKHLVVHTGEKNYVCDLCGKSFTHAESLKHHTLVHLGKKDYACPVCHKTFIQSGGLRKHMLTHTGQKDHVCDICGQAFAVIDTLRKHKMVHTGERSFVCEICHKGFTKAWAMEQHKRIHTGQRDHVCSTCNKAFTQASILKQHVRTHTSQREHVCDICNKAFKQGWYLKQHRQSHECDQKDYVCHVCGKVFAESGSLKKHRVVHRDLENDQFTSHL